MPPSWQPIPSNSCPESKRPFLFLHGLGMGLAQYATLLNYLSLDEGLKDRPICVLLQPSISMSFFSRGYLKPPGEEEGREGLKRIIQKWRFDESGVTVLSHSNGTVCLFFLVFLLFSSKSKLQILTLSFLLRWISFQIVHGWLVKGYPELVTRSCFVDPVCFCLWEVSLSFPYFQSNSNCSFNFFHSESKCVRRIGDSTSWIVRKLIQSSFSF